MTLRYLVLGRISFCIVCVSTSRLLLCMRRNINLAIDVLLCTLFLLASGEKMHATHRVYWQVSSLYLYHVLGVLVGKGQREEETHIDAR